MSLWLPHCRYQIQYIQTGQLQIDIFEPTDQHTSDNSRGHALSPMVGLLDLVHIFGFLDIIRTKETHILLIIVFLNLTSLSLYFISSTRSIIQ